MSHAYCRDVYAKYITSNQGAGKGHFTGILRLPAGDSPEDLSLFSSLTCKNNVILDYYGGWRTCPVSFTHG